MTTETTAAERIAKVIRRFPFWNYGMDDVDPRSKDAEWVPALAGKIAKLDLCSGAQVEEDGIRAAERERVARYLERAADRRDASGKTGLAYDAASALAFREAVAWIREPSVWVDEGGAE